MTDYDVLAEYQRALAESSSPDPHDCAPVVAISVPPKHRVAAIEQLLHRVAREVARELDRNRATASDRLPADVVPMPSRFEKHAEHIAVLGRRLWIGPDRDDWKFVGDCTSDDLRRAAATRRAYAEGALRNAERLEATAAILDAQGVERVADLPPVALTGVADDLKAVAA